MTFKWAGWMAVALGLAACAKSVDVKSTFPEPVLEPLPLSMGLRLPADLTEFVHREDPLTDAEWEIRVGDANAQMFRTVLGAMFEKTVELEPDGTTDVTELGLDAVIEPRLDELEFAVPAHSGNDQFTVWLKYYLKVMTPSGDEIVDWKVTAYGQQDQGRLGLGAEEAMRAAAVRALRDAGANIALNFAGVPEIQRALLAPQRVGTDIETAPANESLEDTLAPETEIAPVTDVNAET